jgi:hypothetical protein
MSIAFIGIPVISGRSFLSKIEIYLRQWKKFFLPKADLISSPSIYVEPLLG